MDRIFRKGVQKERSARVLGDVVLIPTLRHAWIVGSLCVWSALIILWLFLGSYSRKESVNGWLEPLGGTIRVYSENTGMISKVLVEEGQKVIKGQPIILVEDSKILADGESLNGQLVDEYKNQIKFLYEQIEQNEEIFSQNQIDIQQQISSAKTELTYIYKQLDIISKRQSVLNVQRERIVVLISRGYSTAAELENFQTQDLLLKAERQELQQKENAQKGLIRKLQVQQKLQPEENIKIISQLKTRVSEIEQQIKITNTAESYLINAPDSGTIYNLQVVAGQRLQQNSIPLLTILPNKSQLIAHLLIPVRAAGFINVNQTINIRYDAFPYQKFGIYSGKISNISRAIMLPSEVLNASTKSDEPVYRVTATIDQDFVLAYGNEFILTPGMTLSADVELSKRTLMQWLFEPIISLKGRI